MTCATCRHFHTDDKRSECRRYPPTVQLVTMPHPLRHGAVELKPMAVFPPVASSASCGEFNEIDRGAA